jgi:hypothetical protein
LPLMAGFLRAFPKNLAEALYLSDVSFRWAPCNTCGEDQLTRCMLSAGVGRRRALVTWVEAHAEVTAHAEGPCELTRFVVHELLAPCDMGVCELAALSPPSRAAAAPRSLRSLNTRNQSSSGGEGEGGNGEDGRVGAGEGSSGSDGESESDGDDAGGFEEDEAVGRGAALAGAFAAPPRGIEECEMERSVPARCCLIVAVG